jgi:hypothetical protein
MNIWKCSSSGLDDALKSVAAHAAIATLPHEFISAMPRKRTNANRRE